MSNVNRPSFGSWRVTRADPAFPALDTASVEIRLTPNELILLDDHGGSLGAWPLDEVTLYVRGNPHEVRNDNEVAVLRLGSQRLEIKSIERHGSHRDSDLRDAISERQASRPFSQPMTETLEAPAPERWSGSPALSGCLAPVFGLVVWTVLWLFGFMVLGSISLPKSDPIHSADPILWAVMLAAFLGGPTLGIRVGLAIARALR